MEHVLYSLLFYVYDSRTILESSILATFSINFCLSSWLKNVTFLISCLSLYQYSKTKILFHLCKSVFCKVSYKTTVGFKLFPSDFFFNQRYIVAMHISNNSATSSFDFPFLINLNLPCIPFI